MNQKNPNNLMAQSIVKGLTATIIFQGQSLNYDEGYGNLSIIKKLHRGNGQIYTYSSRQSLRYSIFTQGNKEFGWMPSKIIESGSGTKKVIQLTSNIKECQESDLFGYMRTDVDIGNDKKVSIARTAPVRITPAFSLEPYSSDIEMLTNIYQVNKEKFQPNIANMEHHLSLYKYTIAIDLHRIGNEKDKIGTRISPNNSKDKEEANKYEDNFLRNIDIEKDEKFRRVDQFLDVISNLYRDIRGRREDLKPLFIIGGVYDKCNPFFENIVLVEWYKDKPRIIVDPIVEFLENNNSLKQNTFIGIRNGFFDNKAIDFTIKEKTSHSDNISNIGSPEFMIKNLKEMVENYYNSLVKNHKK